MTTTSSIAELQSAGVKLEAAEAVAITQQLIQSLRGASVRPGLERAVRPAHGGDSRARHGRLGHVRRLRLDACDFRDCDLPRLAAAVLHAAGARRAALHDRAGAARGRRRAVRLAGRVLRGARAERAWRPRRRGSPPGAAVGGAVRNRGGDDGRSPPPAGDCDRSCGARCARPTRGSTCSSSARRLRRRRGRRRQGTCPRSPRASERG